MTLHRAVALIAVAVLLAALVLVASACGPPPPERGEVIGRTYTPAWVESYVQQTYTGQRCTGGKTQTCWPTYIYTPATRHHPERWTLRLRDCSTGECREGDRDVTAAEYDRYAVGDQYPALR